MKITMKRNKKDYSENKINVYQICLVALAVGINIVGGQIALFMKLPVYLDSIGTILTGAVLGPWFGMLPNLISGIFMAYQPDMLVYRLCIYSTWRKPQRVCKAMQECTDRFSAEWILAWSVMEFCCMGTDPWNLYGWCYMPFTD